MCGVVGAALAASAATAQQPFYAGKQLIILVNYDAGGATDLEARLLSRHIGKHIPGNPRIIVQNMGGAAGIIGTKYLGEVAPRDGSMVGYFTGSTQRYVSNPERFKVDFRTYEFIAVLPSGRIHFMRTDIKPGMQTAADVIKGENIVVGGLRRDGPKDLSMRLTLDMLGANYKYVTGYNSSAQAMIALQRGEISYYADSPPLYKTKIEPQVKAGALMPVFYDAEFDGKEFSVPRYIKNYDIMPFHELYKTSKATHAVGRAVGGLQVDPAGQRHHVPADGAAAGRAAGRGRCAARSGGEARQDQDYIDEANKVMGDVPEYVTGPTLNDDVRHGLTIRPELKEFMDAYAKRVTR